MLLIGYIPIQNKKVFFFLKKKEVSPNLSENQLPDFQNEISNSYWVELQAANDKPYSAIGNIIIIEPVKDSKELKHVKFH